MHIPHAQKRWQIPDNIKYGQLNELKLKQISLDDFNLDGNISLL